MTDHKGFKAFASGTPKTLWYFPRLVFRLPSSPKMSMLTLPFIIFTFLVPIALTAPLPGTAQTLRARAVKCPPDQYNTDDYHCAKKPQKQCTLIFFNCHTDVPIGYKTYDGTGGPINNGDPPGTHPVPRPQTGPPGSASGPPPAGGPPPIEAGAPRAITSPFASPAVRAAQALSQGAQVAENLIGFRRLKL